MREIKFRAWDPIKKEMWFNQFCVTAYGCINQRQVAIEYFSWKNEDWILLQYTGLKDKNGIEIYEGDIVKYWDGSTESVTWNNCGYWSGWGTLGISEVIGNIYQNPELLDDNTAG